MNRRQLLAGTAAIAAGAVLATGTANAKTVAYSPEKLQALRQAGKPVLLDFYASWCTTCRAQERVVNALIGGGGYGDLTVVKVDWDTYRSSELVRDLNIPRRSTLVLIKGNQELGRVVAQTSEASIKALLDKAA